MRIVVLRDSGSSAVEEMVPRSGESYFVIHVCTIHGHVDAMIPTTGKIYLKTKADHPQNHMGLWDMC